MWSRTPTVQRRGASNTEYREFLQADQLLQDIYCATSKMDRKERSEGEESGWTSYLDTKSYCNVSLLAESSSTSSSYCSNKTLNVEEEVAGIDYKGVCVREAQYLIGDEELKSSHNIERIKKVIHNMARAGSGSSTLSDASNSFSLSKKPLKRYHYRRSAHQIIRHPKCFKKCNQVLINQTTYKLRKSHDGASCSSPVAAPNYAPEMQDTATSSCSPSSSAVLLLRATEDSSSSIASCSSSFKMNVNINCDQIRHAAYTFDELEGSTSDTSDAVSTRFKALEALIPRLKEVAGKGKEEEMVKVIEGHVRALELKVQLLSSVWQLTQLKHL